MDIGTLLTMETNDSKTGEVRTYRSKVVEKNTYYLFIDLLIDNDSNKTAFFPEGTHFKATFIGRDQSVHSFHTEICTNVTGNVPMLAVSIPPKDKITTIQRRQFVRVDTAVDVAIHSTNDSFTTVTSDISGGGMSIILPEPFTVINRERADVWAVLPMHSGEFRYIQADAEVIRVNDDHEVRTASLKFIYINRNQQQFIIRYCFEKQMEARKKELL